MLAVRDQIICGHASGWISIFQENTWTTQNIGNGSPIFTLGVDAEQNILAGTATGLVDTNSGEVINIPEQPMGIASCFGTLWIITATGLWRFVDESWENFDIGRKTTGKIRASKRRLSVTTIDGIAILDESLTVVHIDTDEQVNDLCFSHGSLFVASDSGIRYINHSHQTKQLSPIPSRFVVVHNASIVYGDNNQLHYHINAQDKHTPAHPLFRDKSDEKPLIWNIVSDCTSVWMQGVDYSIWCNESAEWIRLPFSFLAPLSSVVFFRSRYYIGFDDPKGLAVYKGNKLKPLSGLSYVELLFASSAYIWALTADTIAYSKDGISWRAHSISGDIGSVLSIGSPNDHALYLIADNGIYIFDQDNPQLQVVRKFDQTAATTACWNSTKESFVFSDGKQILEVDLEGNLQEIDTPNSSTITQLLSIKDCFLVGTNNGLWILESNGKQQWISPDESGLAGTYICKLGIVEGSLWALTNSGVTIIDLAELGY